MTDLKFLGKDSADKLAGLIFELASQLHEERVRRLALEETLMEGGLDLSAVDTLVDDDDFRERSRTEADASIRKLLRILEEDGSPEGPLRGEMPIDTKVG